MKTNKVVVFGVQDYAELAWYYITTDSSYEVVAFSVHSSYLPPTRAFCNLPVVAFEDVEAVYPPSDFLFFAPMSPKSMNGVRARIFEEIKAKGYRFASYVSSRATRFENQIGANCFILEDNTLQPFTTIGDNVVLWSGNHIGHHGTIGNHVTFTSHVVMSGHCLIKDFCFFGVNATLKDGLTVEEGTLVGMHSSIIRDTEPWGVYVGSPAKRKEGVRSTNVI